MIEKEQPLQGNDQRVASNNGQPQTSVESDPTQLVRPEVRPGAFPGNERIRFVYPRQPTLRRVRTGVLEATAVSQKPQGILGRVKRVLIGTPIPTSRAEHERLTKFKALAVLSSDVISSVAYATEAILATLIAAGSATLGLTLPIAIAIVCLLAIVALSYRQTIPAYPNGGGSYIVAKDNLGTVPGLVAAASLMIDYVLTVSVSVAAGVQALATLFPALSPIPVIVSIDVVLVLFIMMVNLRGVRESGSIFAIPTYVFIASALLLIIVGIFKSFVFQHNPLIGSFAYAKTTEPLSIFLILKSFAAGCSALTGTEAISNGIPAFKKPEARNAATTLTWMVIILGTLFIGTTILAMSYHIEPNLITGNPTVIGQVALKVFTGPLYFMFPVFQIATLFILTLAANTSYADFPRLSSLLARDHFLPHQFAFRGDRLAFSIGIVALAILASLLLVVFKGDTTALINLYAVGVFMSFTLSQGGMVRHWWKLRRVHPGWQRSMFINGLGALTTLLVAVVISSTKFLSGAWIVVILIPSLVFMFLAIHKHYTHVERERTTEIPIRPKDIHHRFIIPLAHLDAAAKRSLAYALSISKEVTAVHVARDTHKANELRAAWDEWQSALPDYTQARLEIIESGKHSIERSLLDYIDDTQQQHGDETLTVILPEITRTSPLGRLLHNRTALLKIRLFFRPAIVVTNLTYQPSEHALTQKPKAIRHRFIVPIAELDRPSLQSLAYARSISPYVAAAHVALDEQDVATVQEKWERLQKHLASEEETALVVIESPYRSLLRPLLAYIDTVHSLYPEDTLTIILPEFVVAHWWEFPLHNQTAFQLKTALLNRSGIVVTDIPQHLRKEQKPE